MVDVQNHYDDHLGPIYEWYTGRFETACEPSCALFDELDLRPLRTRTAIDFGCGHGLQAVPLAQRGYDVIAIDSCRQLLQSLKDRRGKLSIQTLEANITDCWDAIPSQIDLAVCMGDTLTHLSSPDEVDDLVGGIAAALVPGGTFLTTFRDYVSTPLAGNERFIPVRSDENRILTCFLEYHDQHVRVHDVIHERSGTDWNLTVSSYDKLRLDPRGICSVLRDLGLDIVVDRTQRGMATIAARSTDASARAGG